MKGGLLKLDFGCGDGGFEEVGKWTSPTHDWDMLIMKSWLVANGGSDTIGIDINREKVIMASKRIRNGTHFIVADGTCLPFKDNCFELVHEYGILHHIPNYRDAIKEIARVSSNSLNLMETIDNNKIHSLARRIMGSWRGDKIAWFFTSDELLDELKAFFVIDEVRFWWRSFISETLHWLQKEPKISLYYCKFINFGLRTLHLEKYVAFHIYVTARVKNRN